MFFSITQKTLPKLKIKTQLCPEITTTTKPRNRPFWLLKHASSSSILSQQVIISYTNMFELQKLTKNIKIKQVVPNPQKHKLKTDYIFIQHGFKVSFLN